MAEDAAAAIEGLRTAVDRSRTETTESIDRLRTDLTGRMDQMVTRREHEAEVRRLDQAHAATDERVDDLAKASGTNHAALTKQLEDDRRARKQADDDRAKERRADLRNYLLATITAVGVAVSIIAIMMR